MMKQWRSSFLRKHNPSANSRLIPPNGLLIELRQVVKSFATGAGEFVALNGINLTINAGEFVAIVGKSGSGKSTLINMITGIDRPTAGTVAAAYLRGDFDLKGDVATMVSASELAVAPGRWSAACRTGAGIGIDATWGLKKTLFDSDLTPVLYLRLPLF